MQTLPEFIYESCVSHSIYIYFLMWEGELHKHFEQGDRMFCSHDSGNKYVVTQSNYNAV